MIYRKRMMLTAGVVSACGSVAAQNHIVRYDKLWLMVPNPMDDHQCSIVCERIGFGEFFFHYECSHTARASAGLVTTREVQRRR